ncbi:integrase [Kitasatospora sp. NBC_01287]|nr:integrase [Kitasatospora sp. NBC_01287]
MPRPDSPVVLARWISAGNTHPASAYRDPRWSLGPLIDNPSKSIEGLHWKNCPQEFQDQLRLIAWTMINGELRPTHLRNRARAARGRVSPGRMLATARLWMRLARWLRERGITDLGHCTADLWREYGATLLAAGRSRARVETLLVQLTSLWAFDQLSAHPCGIARPPWDAEGADDFLPAAGGAGSGGENSREPVTAEVMGPLLVWAIRMVEDLSEDILNAWAEARRLSAAAAAGRANAQGKAALERYLLALVRDGAPVPATRNCGATRFAASFVAATTGASVQQVHRAAARYDLPRLAAERPGPCVLGTAVTGRIAGRPWCEHLDFHQAAALMRHLGTAAALTCLYLTGMRVEEALGMRSGCCPDPQPDADGRTGRHLIRSRHYKTVVDQDGYHVSGGAERDLPWVAITPVVRAIRVLERIVPNGALLFDARTHDFAGSRSYTGSLKPTSLRRRIEDFTAWANLTAAAHGLTDQAIPADPHGAVAPARLRRTLAWHIARRPGGLVALAIQYGHLRTMLDTRTANGYGSRSRNGLHSVLDIETALSAAETAAGLRDRILAGERISGVAARQALLAAHDTPHFEGRLVKPTFAARFLARDGAVLHDNPDAYLICVYRRDTALCARTPRDTAPTLNACVPGCSNAVRTDTHAYGLRERARSIDQVAAHAPPGVRDRLHRTAERLRAAADTHDHNAFTPGSDT